MKKLLLLTLALSLPLTQVVRAENDQQDRNKKRAHKRPVAAEAQKAAPGRAPVAARPQPRHVVTQRHVRPETSRAAVNRGVVHHTSRAAVTAQRPAVNTKAVSSAAKAQRGANTANRNFNRNSFAAARSRVIVVRHERTWWVNRFPNTRFVLFGGGYYYWDGGYWFPAYGYSPIYSTYAYNEPIYGYNNLPPGQVILNVQAALRDQGYYRGPIDGLVGPGTRGALAGYQRDHGLVVTEAIDEPTLDTLGLA